VKTTTEYLYIETPSRYEIRDITHDVAKIVASAKIAEGMVLVSAMHITASVFVNDHEPGLWSDIMAWVEGLAPFGLDYAHHRTGEDNGDAHLKRMLLGHQVLLPITGGTLDLGPWERVHYGEFDGMRRKRVVVKVMGE
jgi:secondary thiamine-phosphate synthase enzyme